MTNNASPVVRMLRSRIRLFISIALGIFLFVLFFQPFAISKLDFENTLLFTAGFGGIVFLLTVISQGLYQWIFQKNQKDVYELVLPGYLSNFILVIITAVALSFYLRYVGNYVLTFIDVFKLIIIGLASPVSIALFNQVEQLKMQNAVLVLEKKKLRGQITNLSEENLSREIEFVSENASENLVLRNNEIALIRSADNYVEIVFRTKEGYKKKLVRNTLRNIELQLKSYQGFVRCHRTCIVNTQFVEKLHRNYGNHWLSIKGFADQIPVSRQYLLSLKEVL